LSVSARGTLVTCGLLALLIAVAGLSLGVGPVHIAPGDVLSVLREGPTGSGIQTDIVWQVRLPRVLLAMIVGASLASAGSAYQGLFRNPLADPFVIGASSGAALGATVAILLPVDLREFGFGPVAVAAFVGGLGAVGLVYSVAEVGGRGSVLSLLLAGAALSSMLSAVVSLLMLLNNSSFLEVFTWLLGGFGGRGWTHVRAAAIIAPLGVIGVWMMARPLDALACGEETAQTLGLGLRWARLAIVGAATLATAIAVSVGGTIGFVGLVAPHLARRLFGSEHGRLIPTAALLGALLLVLADDAARTLIAPTELPVGVLTSILGGPFFLALLRRSGSA
jgi:iron complex transport system permease protein